MVLIFDMDGVLLDSNPYHREAWSVFNRQFGLETTEEMHQRMYGKRNDQIVRDFFGEALTAEQVAAHGAAKEEIYRRLIESRLEEVLVPGLRAFLERYQGTPKAIATNAEPANVNFLLDGAGLRRYFQVVVDGHQVTHPKPHPEVYLKAAQELKAAPADCVVLEDSYSGVQAALAAGMQVIGIRTTHDSLPGTAITVDNFVSGELTEWLSAQRWAG